MCARGITAGHRYGENGSAARTAAQLDHVAKHSRDTGYDPPVITEP
jgi:hypothetical protein